MLPPPRVPLLIIGWHCQELIVSMRRVAFPGDAGAAGRRVGHEPEGERLG